MVAAALSANPLKLDVGSHIKCLLICFIATISTFPYGGFVLRMGHQGIALTQIHRSRLLFRWRLHVDARIPRGVRIL